jgi:hypothetical protein
MLFGLWRYCLLPLLLALMWSLGSAQANTDATESGELGGQAPAAPFGQAARVVALPPLRHEMQRFDPQAFLQDRHRLTQSLLDLRETLNSAIRPAPLEVDLLLDLAALHLVQRMLPEAQSFRAALPDRPAVDLVPGGVRLSPGQMARATVLGAAIDGFSGKDRPVPEGWADAPLFQALSHIARGEFADARPNLAAATQILGHYPPALSDPVWPQLLLAAIESGAWDVARDLAGQIRDDSGRQNSSAYRYLLGRAAEVGGDRLAAFDNHAAAASGTDEWAQHARLALIDLGRTTGTLTVADMRQLLTQTRALWHGGPLGLATLQRLAALETADQRDLPALAVLADIMRLHPATPEAEAALQQSRFLIEQVYDRGLAAKIPLAEFIAAHRAITRNSRSDAGFDRHAEAFADHLLASGASALAAAEYRALRARIAARPAGPVEAAPEGNAVLPDPSADRLRLKEASALMQGGRYAEAEVLLSIAPDGQDRDLMDRHNLMRAQVLAATGRHADVLGTQMRAPSRDYLRLRAEAAFALSDWEASRGFYEQLFRSLGSAMPPGDRINLLLATHRSGDAARLQELIRSFPDQGDHWSALASGLNTVSLDVFPLRSEAARERVEHAATALRFLQSAGGDEMR